MIFVHAPMTFIHSISRKKKLLFFGNCIPSDKLTLVPGADDDRDAGGQSVTAEATGGIEDVRVLSPQFYFQRCLNG